ncbi:MAG: polysaccharide pyruvyl transferase family protein [Lachnospiraceae bacterium]
MFSGVERKLDVGPCEFLSLIKYADYVVTNSFHGTVFSIIYEKNFVSVVSGHGDKRRNHCGASWIDEMSDK